MRLAICLMCVTSVLALSGAAHAAEAPTALELVFHDAVCYQPMDAKSAAEHLKDPAKPLAPAMDKDGKPLPLVRQPLHVYLGLEQPGGTVRLARAAQEVRRDRKSAENKAPPLGPWTNYAVHEADGSGLRWRDGRLAGTLTLTVKPDMTHHGQRVPAECRLELDAAPGGDGKYKGRYGQHDVEGKVTCQAAATVDLARPCETTLMINNAMNLPGIGANAPRGCLNASWKDGKAVAAYLGDVYGYNLWTAGVDANGLALRDGRLSGQLTGHVTSSYQGKYAGECVWTIDAVVIGRRVLGNGKGQKTAGKGKVEQFAIAVNGWIANTADLPDAKAWRLDHAIRVREEAGDEGYWHGRNPKDPKPADKPAATTKGVGKAP